MSGNVAALPGADRDHELFGKPGARWVVHQAGHHVHFKRVLKGQVVEGYAYIRPGQQTIEQLQMKQEQLIKEKKMEEFFRPTKGIR
jgi:hypothetical protein